MTMLEKLSKRTVLVELPGEDRGSVARLPAYLDIVAISVLSAPPGAPSKYDVHIVGGSPSGAFSGRSNQIAIWNEGWYFLTPWQGLRAWNAATSRWLRFVDNSWTADLAIDALSVDVALKLARTVVSSGAAGQGGNLISTPLVIVTGGSTVHLTLPGLEVGAVYVVLERKTINTASVYPGSGDQIEALGTNNPASLNGGSMNFFVGDTSVWRWSQF